MTTVAIRNDEVSLASRKMETMIFLALDLETTGLNPKFDAIVQVSWKLLDKRLRDISDLRDYVVQSSSYVLDRLEDNLYVFEMHTKTGLWAKLNNPDYEKLLLDDIEDELIKDINAHNPDHEPVHLLGASVHFDRSFIDYHMQQLSTQLNHRILDVSSLKLVAQSTAFDISASNPMPHNSMYDVLESIEVARTARRMFRHAQRLAFRS